MKYVIIFLSTLFLFNGACDSNSAQQFQNKTAANEQQQIEQNQSTLNRNQPSPRVTWSMERANLINRFKMMNDRSIVFYMYIFNYGIKEPVGHYIINKVSSVNSQLTNPSQIVLTDRYDVGGEYGYGHSAHVLESPQEDGSYGTNGDAVFGFTPDMIYLEHNMQYIVSTVPLGLNSSDLLASVSVADLEQLNKLLDKLDF